MTRRRWIADEVEGGRAALVGAHAEHLARVLRARVGQEFDIAAGEKVFRGRIAAIGPDQQRIEFELGDVVQTGSLTEVSLLLSIFKFDRMEWAVEKCTEIGVSLIVPVVARRTDLHLAKAAEKRVERWRRIALQAAEQSRSTVAPQILAPAKLDGGLLESRTGTRIVLSESEQRTMLNDLVEVDSGAVTLAIGPEGGWTREEIDLFARHGWIAASVGNRILRAETAAIVSVALATMQ